MPIRKLCQSMQTLMESLSRHIGMVTSGFVWYGGQGIMPQQHTTNMNLKSFNKEENMANIYWNKGDKTPKEEAVKALMAELVNCTDNRFFAKADSDGAGAHICAYVETIHTDNTNNFVWKKQLPDKFMGWRLIRIFVPIGYIDGIMLAKETKNDY